MTAGFPWPDVMAPLVFVDVPQGRETSTSENTSYCNLLEAKVVLEVVRGLLTEGEVDASQVGVISPYRGQVRFASLRTTHIDVLRASEPSDHSSSDAYEVRTTRAHRCRNDSHRR
jgi:hypothetical protein